MDFNVNNEGLTLTDDHEYCVEEETLELNPVWAARFSRTMARLQQKTLSNSGKRKRKRKASSNNPN